MALDSLYDYADNVYKIDQFTEMEYAKSVWGGNPACIIYNCQRTIELLPVMEDENVSRSDAKLTADSEELKGL